MTSPRKYPLGCHVWKILTAPRKGKHSGICHRQLRGWTGWQTLVITQTIFQSSPNTGKLTASAVWHILGGYTSTLNIFIWCLMISYTILQQKPEDYKTAFYEIIVPYIYIKLQKAKLIFVVVTSMKKVGKDPVRVMINTFSKDLTTCLSDNENERKKPEPQKLKLVFRIICLQSLYPWTVWFQNSLYATMCLTSCFAVQPNYCVKVL